MAYSAISDEITRHIEIALFLSKREFLLRLLEEAGALLRSEQLAAARIIARTVLDEVVRIVPPDALFRGNARAWNSEAIQRLVLRAPDLTGSHVQEMLDSAKGILTASEQQSQTTSDFRPSTAEALAQTRGKYAFVGTSVESFLQRKREDIEREDRRCP